MAPDPDLTGAAEGLPEEARAAAMEAAFLRLLGLLFERPRPGWAGEVQSLAGETSDPRLRDLAPQALITREGDYLALFGPGGCVSPREVAYVRFRDPGQMMADLSGLYAAFGFRPRAEDPIDHIGVETGFAGFLVLKAAYALSVGNSESADQARKTLALFLETHLRPFAASLRARLAGAPLPHVERAATLLAEWAGCPPMTAGEDKAAADSSAVPITTASAEYADSACSVLLDDENAADTCGACGSDGRGSR
jgi:nitrate reductase assembly molybdenum cofactor insertion protein NarJ